MKRKTGNLKRTLGALLFSLSLTSGAGGTPRAEELIETLHLIPLNLESGLFSVVSVSDIEVRASDGNSPAGNCIYLMLSKTHPQNYLQWLYSDDYQVLIEGGPADYFLFFEDGRVEKITMGRDLSQGQRLIVPSPGGTAKAIMLHDSANYLLVGSIVTPAWSPRRARIGAEEDFIEKYAGSAAWATPEFLKKLIGPNFGKVVGADGGKLKITVDSQGQIIWQSMQLTEKQFLVELRNFAAKHKDRPLEVFIEKGAPDSTVERVTLAAKREGVREISLLRKTED